MPAVSTGLWDSHGWSERWKFGPGLQSEASAGCSDVSSELLVPLTQQLMGGSNNGYNFMLLLTVYALDYLG